LTKCFRSVLIIILDIKEILAMSKVGRNAPCPCGSGKKYKKCHGNFQQQVHPAGLPAELWAELDQKRKEMEALRMQREKQQGLGRQIVSHVHHGYRFVAVGAKLHWQKEQRWKTFHVFLSDHFLSWVGSKWVAVEKGKPTAERHTIIKWLEQFGADLAKFGKSEGGVRTGPMTGAIQAYLNLAYNIYLIGHNTLSQGDAVVRSYVKRLKSARSDDFIGAVFETYAAAALLKSGFELEFENERDGSASHVEFVATCPRTGKKFSVEVKARDWASVSSYDGTRRLRVASKLNQALAKQAQHPRLVFIEVNVPDIIRTYELTGWPEVALQEIRQNEQKPDVNQKSAYVIITNHAFHSNLDAINAGAQVLVTGFNIPDFGPDVQFDGYRAVLEMRKRHVEMFSLLRSMETHYEIPASFDGEMADLAFVGDALPRLRFGNMYLVPDKNGTEVAGRFYDATVDEASKLVYGVFELADGQHVIATVPLSEAELAGYRRHPETFFGEVRRPSRRCSTFVEFCDFFYEVYQKTDRDRLLQFMSGARDYGQLEGLTQKELAITYAERCAWQAFRQGSKKETKLG
jgi:hypothetical protein